jgi:hypothetical protein
MIPLFTTINLVRFENNIETLNKTIKSFFYKLMEVKYNPTANPGLLFINKLIFHCKNVI